MADDLPARYDSDRKLVIYEGETVGAGRAAHFVKEACDAYLCFGEREKLIWAIDNALPEILESALARSIISDLVREHTIGSEARLGKKREEFARNNAIFREIWELIGEGYSAYFQETDTFSGKGSYACELVAERHGLATETVIKLFKSLGGKDPQGSLAIIAGMSESQGNMRKRKKESGE